MLRLMYSCGSAVCLDHVDVETVVKRTPTLDAKHDHSRPMHKNNPKAQSKNPHVFPRQRDVAAQQLHPIFSTLAKTEGSIEAPIVLD